MKRKLEIVIIQTNCLTFQGSELYWMFSRSQLEFLFKELEIFSSPTSINTAKYQEVMVPVVSIEKYYGFEEKAQEGHVRYLVVRSVTEQNDLVKIIVQTSQPLKINKLETGMPPLQPLALPKNSDDILGVYSIDKDKIGVIPDFVKMSKALHL